MDTKDILETELSEEDASKLSEAIQSWKEEYSKKIEESIIEELNEKNNAWKEEVAEAYSEKFLDAINELKEDVRAEVLAESVNADPVHKVMEQVVKLVAPLISEDYVENTYMSEIKTLRAKIAEYERKEALNEGEEIVEQLIEDYDDEIKPMLRALIGKGTPEEVTERYESIAESLKTVVNEEDDDFDDDEDIEFDFEDEEVDFEDESEIEEESYEKSSIVEEDSEDDRTQIKRSAAREKMMKLI